MQEPVRPNLAISLHAPTKELRRELMPIEERYDIKDVIAAAQRYPIPRGGAVTYEYVLLGGVNDQPAHARALVRLLAGAHGKVNLIPLNPAPEIPFAPPDARRPSTSSAASSRRRACPSPCAARAGRTSSPPAASSTSSAGRSPYPPPSPPERTLRGPRRPPALGRADRARSRPLRGRAAALARGRAPGAGRDLLHGRRARDGGDGRLAGAALPGRAFLRQARAHLLADGGVLPRLRVLARARDAWSRRWPRWPRLRPRPGWAACSWAGAPPCYGALALGTTLLVLSFGRVAMSDMLLTLWCTLAVAIGVTTTDERGATVARDGRAGSDAGPGLPDQGTGGARARRLRPRPAGPSRPRRPPPAPGRSWAGRGRRHLRDRRARLVRRRRPGGWAPVRSSTSSSARTSSASRARPTTPTARRCITCGPTSRPACPGRCSSRWPPWRGARRAGFLLLWMGLMAVPLSLSRGKIDYYLLPLLPAASLVIGSHLAAEWDRIDRAWARAALIAFAPIALVPAALQPHIPTDWLPGWPSPGRAHRARGRRRPGRGPGRGAALTVPRGRRVRGRNRGHPRPPGRRVPARLPRRPAQRRRRRRRAARARVAPRCRARRLRRSRARRDAISSSRRG